MFIRATPTLFSASAVRVQVPRSSPHRPLPQPAPPPPSVAVVLTRLSNNVKPIADRLRSTPTERATPENLTPDIDNIIGAFETAIDNVEKLQDKPDNVVFASPDGTSTLTPDNISDLLDFIVKRIFMAINGVLSLTSIDLYAAVLAQFVPLGQVTLYLVGVVAHLDDGVFNKVGDVLGPVLDTIQELDLDDVVDEILDDSE